MTEQEWIDIFSSNLRDIMNERGFTQKSLADAIGVSQPAISGYLKGRCMPTVKVVVNLVYVLGCDFEELMDFGDTIL